MKKFPISILFSSFLPFFSTGLHADDVIDALELPPALQQLVVTWDKPWQKPSAVSGCRYYKFYEKKVDCTVVGEASVVLKWGKQWADKKVKPIQGNAEIGVSGTDISPVFDPKRLRYFTTLKKPPDKESCTSPAGYTPAWVWFCKKSTFAKSQCRRSHYPIIKGENRLPSLGDVSWRGKSLPKSVYVELDSTSSNQQFRRRLYAKLPNANVSGIDKHKSMDEQVVEVYNVQADSNPSLHYDLDARMMLFPSKASCINSTMTGNHQKVVYMATAFADIKATVCSWAKVTKKKSDVSFCTRAKVWNKNIRFHFRSNQIVGKREVLIVANSEKFAREGRGRAFREALITWLAEIRGEYRPINILLLEGDGKIHQLMRGEDLVNMEEYDQDNPKFSIKHHVLTKLQFTSSGFEPLKDLAYTERRLSALGINQLSKVMYVTDSSLPLDIYYADLGTPLGWKRAKVKFQIVTDGGCNRWREKTDTQCVKLNEFPQNVDILQLLRGF